MNNFLGALSGGVSALSDEIPTVTNSTQTHIHGKPSA